MIRRTLALSTLAALLLLATAAIPYASAAPLAAGWKLTLIPMPANFAPGASSEYFAVATNVGSAPSEGEVTLKTIVPPGLNLLGVEGKIGDPSISADPECKIVAQGVTCTTTEHIHPGYFLSARVKVEVPLGTPEETLTAQASVSGGNAAQEVDATAPTPISPDPVKFDFLGFSSPLINPDGSPATEAGSHPYQFTVDLGFPSENPGGGLTGAGHPRDILTEVPPGLIGDPAATPVLCTEAELTSEITPGCPEESQVGVVDLTTTLEFPFVEPSALYNMVPPPGTPAEFALNAAGIGIFVHLTTSVRSDGDYGVDAAANDVLALGRNPILNVKAQLWGDPSSPSHENSRGPCVKTGDSCFVPAQETAFLTLPGDCPGEPITTKARADSWEEPSPEFEEREASYESADLAGNPVSIDGCNELEFKPTIKARPTTDLTDSPSGLDFELHQPQETSLAGRSTAALRDATITFPTGMTVNPSQAGGLGACSEDQIGFEEREGGVRFSKAPQSCPDAAKIGSLEVSSPLLVKRNEEHKVETDTEGNPIPEALHGSVYIAKPFANPFGSLVAVYLAIEDPKTGIVAKLAGEGKLDPATGQVTTHFDENPQLPLEDVKVHIFGGPRGAFITPPTCAPSIPYATTTDLRPWTAPEGADASPEDSFELTAAPGGGPCPASVTQMSNAPNFNAGTLSPAAGAYSPLIFRLHREDGSQRLAKIEATLPPGLSAKLAGVSECNEAEIAKAEAREHPNLGAAEQADPSCPAASEVGVVNVGAGAGPTPFYTQGHAYLAGPYKGAPLSLAIITPAVAGPFDLGTVVVRTALYIDPTTAQGRAVSDSLPTILDGIPLDVRSVALKLSRPQFTFNPTSCNVLSFTGTATSALGAPAPLSQRFQAGGCGSLPYRPQYRTRLFGPTHRGGHPRLRAIFEAKPGEANTARIAFALPHSEFIDQAHFRTICTRVQFSADQCPPGSIYGHITATSPQVDYTLEGPIYLRSSTHELPDVVAVLKGPASQPVEVDLDGRVDSVNGGVRTTFETIPDAPVIKAVVNLQGGKKGLFENSTDICRGSHRATLNLTGQNGKAYDTHPALKADCGKKAKKKHGGHKH